MNTEAIKSELQSAESKLSSCEDRFDSILLESKIRSLKAELAGIERNVDMDYSCND